MNSRVVRMVVPEARFKDAMFCIPIVNKHCIYFVHTILAQVLAKILNRMAVAQAPPRVVVGASADHILASS